MSLATNTRGLCGGVRRIALRAPPRIPPLPDQPHPNNLNLPPRLQPREVAARGHGAAGLISSVPNRLVGAGGQFYVYENPDQPPGHVVDCESHGPRCREVEADRGAGVEGVRLPPLSGRYRY